MSEYNFYKCAFKGCNELAHWESVYCKGHDRPLSGQIMDEKVRKCLNCQCDMLSEWAGDRICMPCKKLDKFNSGGSDNAYDCGTRTVPKVS